MRQMQQSMKWLLASRETQTEEALADVDAPTDEAVDLTCSTLKSATISESAYLSDCPTITVNKTSNPQVITIDFGTSCTGKDDKVRSGKIVITSTAFNTFPSVRDFTFDNYIVDGKKLKEAWAKPSIKIRKTTLGQPWSAENITITFPNNEGRHREWPIPPDNM